MFVPNFRSLACLEVPEKFVVGGVWWGGVKHVTTMSTPDASAQSAQNARRILTMELSKQDMEFFLPDLKSKPKQGTRPTVSACTDPQPSQAF